MEWVKGRKLPPCEAIQYNGQPCHTMPELWDALHNTYNSAANRPCDLSVLDELLDLPVQAPFSVLELMEALAACSSLSSPGPDHVTWVHLKKIVAEPQCLNIFIKLANACLTVGRWPKHFKESHSTRVIRGHPFVLCIFSEWRHQGSPQWLYFCISASQGVLYSHHSSCRVIFQGTLVQYTLLSPTDSS